MINDGPPVWGRRNGDRESAKVRKLSGETDPKLFFLKVRTDINSQIKLFSSIFVGQTEKCVKFMQLPRTIIQRKPVFAQISYGSTVKVKEDTAADSSWTRHLETVHSYQ